MTSGDDAIGLTLALLDDLFGGRARIHIFDDGSGELVPLGVDEPVLLAPGPLHDALATHEPVATFVGDVTAEPWHRSYVEWIQRGGCHVAAARIEGGGAVVGVLSVLRSDHSRVPLSEDADLVGALAARFGRTSSVVLGRAVGPAPRTSSHLDATVTAPEPLEPLEPLEPQRAAPQPTPQPTPPASEPAAAPAAVDLGELMLRAIGSALDLPPEKVEISLAAEGDLPDLEARAVLTTALARLVPALDEAFIDGGIEIELREEAGAWTASVRGRGPAVWVTPPALDPFLDQDVRATGGAVDLVASTELGWTVEISTLEGAERPAVEALLGGAPVDLMSASLGDTSSMVMLAVDDDGRVVFCNDELARRLSTPVADLLGRPLAAIGSLSRSWPAFLALLDEVGEAGLAQRTLAWPHPEGRGARVRWTVSRSASQDTGPVNLCFGVDAEVTV